MADGSVIIDTHLDSSGFKNGLKGLGAVASKGLGAVTKAIGAVSTGLVAAGAASVKFGSEFEASLAKASTLFGTVDVDTDNLSKQMLELSDSTGIAANQIGDSLYNALSAGIPATEDMGEAMTYMDSCAKLAKAGFTDIDTAVTSTAKVLNAYKMDVSETDKVHKILMQTQNKGITTVGELGSCLAQVTPTAAAMSVQFEQVGAALATMTAQGTPTAQATTQLNSLFAELGKSGTTAQKGLAKALEGTKYAGKGFKELMAEGVPLNEVIDNMTKYAAENNLSLIDMFSSIEAGKAALAMSGKNAAQFTSNLEAMGTEADVVGEAYDKVSNTLETNVGKIQNSLKNLGIAIYQDVDGPIAEVSKAAAEMVESLNSAFENSGFSGLASEIGNVFSQIVVGIADNAPKIIDTANNVIQSFLKGITDNLPLIVDGVMAIGESLLDAFAKIIPDFLNMGATSVKSIADGMSDGESSLSSTASTLIKSLVSSFSDMLPSLITIGVEVITSLVDGISEALPTVLESAVDIMLSLVDGITDNLDNIVDCALNLIQALIDGLDKALPKLLDKAPEIIEKLANKLIDNLPKIAEAAVKIVLQLATTIIKNAPKIVEATIKIINSLINTIVTNLPRILEMGVKLVGELATGYVKAIPEVVKACRQMIDIIFKNVKGVDWISLGKNIIQGLINGIKAMASNVGGAIKNVCNSAINSAKKALGIHSPSKVFAQIGAYVDEGLANGISNNKNVATSSMTALCDNLKKVVDVDNLVDKMTSAVNGEISITSNLVTSSTQGSMPTSTTNNNTSSMPITINNYGVDKADRNFAKDLCQQVANRLRGRGVATV